MEAVHREDRLSLLIGLKQPPSDGGDSFFRSVRDVGIVYVAAQRE